MSTKKRKETSNPTLLKLRGTPFKSAAELKSFEEKILREEWQNIERARVRLDLLMRSENKRVLSPLFNGLKANFVDEEVGAKHLVRVYLSAEEAIQVDIDKTLKSKDTNSSLESLIRSLIEGLMSGYLSALGLTSQTVIKPNSVVTKDL